jgi:excisionase family DNA binding protein
MPTRSTPTDPDLPQPPLTLELSQALVESIAQRAAAIVLERLVEVQTDGSSPFLTIPEAAAYARCKRQRIDDLLSRRRLTRYKDGRRTLVSRAELEAYLAATTGPRSGRGGDSILPGTRATVTRPGNR